MNYLLSVFSLRRFSMSSSRLDSLLCRMLIPAASHTEHPITTKTITAASMPATLRLSFLLSITIALGFCSGCHDCKRSKEYLELEQVADRAAAGINALWFELDTVKQTTAGTVTRILATNSTFESITNALAQSGIRLLP